MAFDTLDIKSFDVEDGDLDKLLGLPDATVSADSLPNSTAPEETSQVPAVINDTTKTEEDYFDESRSLEDWLEDSDEDAPKTKKQPKAEQDADENKDTPAPEEKKTKKNKADDLSESALKQITDYYVAQGIWKEFDGRDELQYTSEVFQEVLDKQHAELAQDKFNELLEQVGPTGKAIIEYVQKGGKADEILDLFKEQKAYQEYEPETDDQRKAYIAQYYKDVHGFSPEKIKRLINAAVADDTLNEEFKDAKTSYGKFHEKEIAIAQQAQAAHVEKQKEAEEVFQSNVTSEIDKRKLTDREKQNLKEALLNYNEKLEDGTKVNKLYVKFTEMQNNMEDYIDFVQFVLDKKKFIERISKAEETKATSKAYFTIKGNSATDKKSGSTGFGNNTQSSSEDLISLW